MKLVDLIDESLPLSFELALHLLILSGVHLFDACELFGGLLLANDALPLAVLYVAHDLLVRLPLLLVLLSLLAQLQLHELLLLLRDRVVFLPTLPRKVEGLLCTTGQELQFTDALRFRDLLFFLRDFEVLNVVEVLLLDEFIVALSLRESILELVDLLGPCGLRVLPLATLLFVLGLQVLVLGLPLE